MASLSLKRSSQGLRKALSFSTKTGIAFLRFPGGFLRLSQATSESLPSTTERRFQSHPGDQMMPSSMGLEPTLS